MRLIDKMAPQMIAYSKQFHTDGEIDWQPYTMFFHPKNYCSDVVNTDAFGFRYSVRGNQRFSIAGSSKESSVRILAGNSVAFGIGASADQFTLASRLMIHDKRVEPWLNFGGRAFNSAQELILMTLYRHLLPKVEEIVLFSGANNLFLSKLSELYIQEHGAFYNAGHYYKTFNKIKKRSSIFSNVFIKPTFDFPCDNTYSITKRIQLAADLTLRHLDGWVAIAKDLDAKLTYVLQPTSGWVRNKGSDEEEALFRELAMLKRYTTVNKDVLAQSVCENYASILKAGVEKKGVSFINISPLVNQSLKSNQFVFIDHTHLTDEGYDITAKLIVNEIK